MPFLTELKQYCSGRPVLAALPGSLVLAVPFWLSCPRYPLLVVYTYRHINSKVQAPKYVRENQ
jgi:hypothetical protein